MTRPAARRRASSTRPRARRAFRRVSATWSDGCRRTCDADRPTPLDADLLRRMREPHGRQFGADIWGLGTMLYAPTAGDAFVFGHDGQNEPAINAAVRINPDNGRCDRGVDVGWSPPRHAPRVRVDVLADGRARFPRHWHGHPGGRSTAVRRLVGDDRRGDGLRSSTEAGDTSSRIGVSSVSPRLRVDPLPPQLSASRNAAVAFHPRSSGNSLAGDSGSTVR